MTQYTQNPYGSDVMEPQQRLSMSALFAMILGIVSLVACCVPVVNLGMAGVVILLAIVGLVSISRSEGRLRGTGMAITGLVLGGLVLLLGGVWTYGAMKFGEVVVPYGEVFKAAEKRDVDLAKKIVVGSGADALTPRVLGEFHDEYSSQVGEFRGIETSVSKMFIGWMSMGGKYDAQIKQLPQDFLQGAMPIIVHFDNGDGVMWMKIDVNSRGTAPGQGYIFGQPLDIALLVEGGSKPVFLLNGRDGSGGGTGGTAPSPKPAPTEAPTAPASSEAPATP